MPIKDDQLIPLAGDPESFCRRILSRTNRYNPRAVFRILRLVGYEKVNLKASGKGSKYSCGLCWHGWLLAVDPFEMLLWCLACVLHRTAIVSVTTSLVRESMVRVAPGNSSRLTLLYVSRPCDMSRCVRNEDELKALRIDVIMPRYVSENQNPPKRAWNFIYLKNLEEIWRSVRYYRVILLCALQCSVVPRKLEVMCKWAE
eukprot:437892-Amphidinium_carterae.1